VAEYPVGHCTDEACRYAEPHRHGLDCDKVCSCDGIGAQVAPLGDDDLQECDWGNCSRPAVATRLDRDASTYAFDGLTVVLDEEVWLSVCSWHAGWDDYPVASTEAERGRP
jgi:translation initiation factor RLI1